MKRYILNRMRNISFIIMMTGFFGCTSPEQEDFVGTWCGKEVELQLRADGTCTATGKNAYLLFTDTTSAKSMTTMNGRWQLEHIYASVSEGRKVIRLNVRNDKNDCSEDALIEYHSYFVLRGLKIEYLLYVDMDDPDVMDWFELRKQKAENNAGEPAERTMEQNQWNSLGRAAASGKFKLEIGKKQ